MFENSKKNKANSARFVIGIDLGTTQCALSYVDLESKSPKVKNFLIPQLVDDGQAEELSTLQSVLYISEEERKITLPEWMKNKNSFLTGLYAKKLGDQIPARFIHSSKSWLCHPRIDRTASTLPWQSTVVKNKLSPVQAATEYLLFLAKAWDSVMKVKDESFAFDRASIIVTIPASFDPVARNLTLEAIENANINSVSLLEEPQAAFYDYLNRNPKKMVRDLKGVDTVLVIDVGGGTTDFSLIKINWSENKEYPEFSRLAVGPHLLIGGDNLDLALARQVEVAFKHKGKKLTSKQWLDILNESRKTKEAIFSDSKEGEVTFTVAGSGSKVLAGSKKITLKQSDIRQTLIEGFFPVVDANEKPDNDNLLGISEAGLPFTKDPAITRHLAAFLSENGIIPDAILFNGGTLQSECFKNRLFEVISLWKGREPHVLSNPHPTLAVAAGAAYYGMVSMGLGHKIHSGNPVSIYLGIGSNKNSKTEQYLPEKLLCLLPKGSETEVKYEVPEKTFGIDLSRDSSFYLYYTPNPPKAEELGRVIKFNSKRYLPLPPISLKAKTGKGEKQVAIEVILKETGYMQVLCKEIDGNFEQDLRFNLSQSEKNVNNTAPAKRRVPITKAQIKKIDNLIKSADAGELAYNCLFKSIEEIMGSKRSSWHAEMLRQLFDIFITDKRFLASESAMSIWFRLIGYSLRPGFGVKGDIERVDIIWDMLNSKFEFKNPEFWSDWWVMWKRIAPGLSIERQNMLKDYIFPILFPKQKLNRKVTQHERNQIWRLIGHLEKLPIEEKEKIGWWAVRAPQSYGKDLLALHAVGRLGARDLAYAPETLLLPQSVANEWASHLLRKAIPGNSYLDWALRELGRKTGDKLVQIDDVIRKKIVDILKQKHRKKSFIQPLIKAARLAEKDLAEFTGESLPSGFLWVKETK